MNIATICAIIRIAIVLLRSFDREGKMVAIVELLQGVQSKLCGEGVFSGSEKTEAAASALADYLKDCCDDDDCKCD